METDCFMSASHFASWMKLKPFPRDSVVIKKFSRGAQEGEKLIVIVNNKFRGKLPRKVAQPEPRVGG